MRDTMFGYRNDFSGLVDNVRVESFNPEERYILDDEVNLFVKNDGTMLYQNLQNGRRYVASNKQYSYSLDAEPNTVVIWF